MFSVMTMRVAYSIRLKDEATKDKDTTKKKKANGFTKLCSLSTRLQEFFGVPEMARTEVIYCDVFILIGRPAFNM